MVNLKRNIIPFVVTLCISPFTLAETILYDGTGSPKDLDWLKYVQIPLPETIVPAFIPTTLVSSLIAPLAEGFGTATLNTDLGSGNTGYVGYTNYTYEISQDVIDSIDLAAVLSGNADIEEILFSGNFSIANESSPVLDRTTGFDVIFNVAVTNETSSENRAGFNVILISQDGQGIELGFKQEGEVDRIFAQSETFKEAEDTNVSDITTATDYVLTVKDDDYTFSADGIEILAGSLRSYQFDPEKSSPSLPFNPYTSPNFVFFGDNTDQANATFTLGTVTMRQHTPALGTAQATNASGDFVETTASFNGGISVKGAVPQTKVTQKLTDSVDVSGKILIDEADLEQEADIFVYAAYKETADAEAVFYMLDEAHNILLWDTKPENLVSFQEKVTLPPEQYVSMYQGQFILPGFLCISFGYRLTETGTLISNNQCIEVEIQ